MINLNDNVVYVKGALNGAIYNFNSGDIFSINSNSCATIEKIIAGEMLNQEEIEYKELLITNNLLVSDYDYKNYTPSISNFKLNTCWLEITQGCNCKCVHCYEGQIHNRTVSQLSLDEWFNVINQLFENGFTRFVVIGGEPCVNKDVGDILQYVSQNGGDVTLFTNGTIINEKLKNIIIHNNIKIKFSIYGHNSCLHDSITKHPGSFNLLMNNIKFFMENKVNVSASVILMKENEKYYKDIYNFLDLLQIKYKSDVIREVFGGSQSHHVPKNTELVRSFYKTLPRFPKITKKKFDLACNYNTCWYGKLVISEDGSVLPCVFERNSIIGNVKNQTIKEILNTSKLKKFWGYKIDNVEGCKECEFRYGCKDCRPLAASCGNINAKNPRCTYDVINGEWK